jgi:putative tryptophan/tyrosine transport system permease protein
MLFLKYSSLEVIFVLGAYFVFKRGKFPDFGLVGSFLLASFISAKFYSIGIPNYFLPILGLISGALVGISTTLLHYKLKINPILSGICSLFLVYSICYFLIPECSYNAKYPIWDFSNLKVTIVFISIFFVLSLIFSLVELSNFGTSLRAGSLSSSSLTFLSLNRNRCLAIFVIAGNALVGLNASLRFFITTNVKIDMVSGFLEEVLIEMVLGLFIFDLIYFFVLKLRNVFRNRFLNPTFLRFFEYLIPLLGTVLFQFVYRIGIMHVTQGYHLRAVIILILIFLVVLTNILKINKYSKLDFIGLNVADN